MTIGRWASGAATLGLLGLAGPAALAHSGPHDPYGGAYDGADTTPILLHRTLGGDIAVGMRVPATILGPAYAVEWAEDWALPTPPPNRRWVRYWDDALLIDERGIVRDVRRGVDWDEARLASRYDASERYGAPYADDADWDESVPIAPERPERYARRRYDPRCFGADDRPKAAAIAGAVGGAVIGGVAGNLIAGRGDRTSGTLIGGGLGAVAGGLAGSELGRDRTPIGPCPGDELARDDGDELERYDDYDPARGERTRVVVRGEPGRTYGRRPVVTRGPGGTTTVVVGGGERTTVTTTTYEE